MIDVLAEDDGLGVAVGGLEVLGDLAGHHHVAPLQHQLAVHVGPGVDPVLDDVAVLVGHARRGAPAVSILVQVHPDDLVGRQIAVLDALLQAVGVDRLAKVVGVGNLACFLGRGGQADLRGAVEVAQHLAPGRVLGRAAPVAFVHHDQVEEVRAELLVDVALFFRTGDGLVERQVDFVALVDQLGAAVHRQVQRLQRYLPLGVDPLHTLAVGAQLGHGALERAEVVDHGLVDQDVPVGQEQDALLGTRLPQPPDDLESGIGLPGAGSHHQQHTLAPLGDGFHGAVDRVHLVVARRLAGRVVVPGHGANIRRPAFPGTVPVPQLRWAWKLVKREVALQHPITQGGIAEHETVAVGGKAERHAQQLGVQDGLRHTRAHGVLVVLDFDHRQRNVCLEEQGIVGTHHGALVASRQASAHHHAAHPQRVLAVNLRHAVPARLLQRRADEALADVAFRQVLLVQPRLLRPRPILPHAPSPPCTQLRCGRRSEVRTISRG